MRRFFIDQPVHPGTKYTIKNPDANHISNVLRMKTGDEIWLFDGAGHEFRARLTGLSGVDVTIEITDSFTCLTEPPISITVGQALLKNKKIDTTLRQLTELGIDSWIPVNTERSVSKIAKKNERSKTGRWQTIVKESVKQCQRGLMPKIYPPLDYKEALNLCQCHDLNLVFSDGSGELLDKIRSRTRKAQTVFMLLGPEGGFTSQEIEMARQQGFIAAGLGPRILKADTAAIAACAIVQALFGDIGGKD